jgi:hypothetical protein
MNSASKAFGEGAAKFEISSEPITALQVFEHVIFRCRLAVRFVVVAVAISSSSNILMLAIRSPFSVSCRDHDLSERTSDFGRSKSLTNKRKTL